MKLSEIKNEQAIEVLGDLIDPVIELCKDKYFGEAMTKGDIKKAVKVMLKGHAKAVKEILAALDGVPVDMYECNILTLPKKLIEIMSDPDVLSLFTSADVTEGATPSTSALESTEI